MELNIVKKILPKEDILVLLKMFDRESEPSLSSHIDLDKWSIKLENAVFIHCYLNGEIIGTLAYYIGEYIFITHIAVKSEYRRLHVAQKMLDSLLLTAKKDIKLIVRKDNVAAIKFYEKNHFQLSEEDNNEYVLIRKAEPSNVHQYEVCVHCPTYNHSLYIEDCLNGFIMQKTTFPFCVVIVDDASTDGNQEIIKQYAEKYPDIIKPVLLQENHFSQKKSKRPYYSSYDEQSKYVAMCEGDDYWTDPLKLQKQVDFMEVNLNYGICCHRFFELPIDGSILREDHFSDIINSDCNGLELNRNNYLIVGKLPQVLTVLYRYDMLKKSRYEQIRARSKYDQSMFYAMVQVGPIWIMNENMGVYRRHQGGVATSIIGSITASKKHYLTWKDIYEVYQTEETKSMYIHNLRAYIYRYVKISSNLSIQELISLIKEIRLVINKTDLLSLYLKIIRAYLIRLINKIKS